MTDIVQQDLARIASYQLDWQKLGGKTVFITGATGFIGSTLIGALMMRVKMFHEDIRVIAFVRDMERARKKFKDYPATDHIQFLQGDVLSPVLESMHIDYVIHCASNAAPDKYASDPVGTMRINFFGTSHILDFAKQCGASKFLYVSTIEVFGKTNQAEPLLESDFGYISSSNVRSCYPESKKCCENLVICYGRQHGIDVSIGRLSYIYGAGISPNDSKVCALFARKAAVGEDIVLKSKGEQLRSYTYISDAITALLTVLLRGQSGQDYNIASSTSRITIADMAKKCCEFSYKNGSCLQFDCPNEKEKTSFSFIANAVMDSDKLETLGWRAQVSIEDGLRYAIADSAAVLRNK